MLEAAEALEFERAAMLRDQIREFRRANGMEDQQFSTGAAGLDYRKARVRRMPGRGSKGRPRTSSKR